MYVVPGEGAAVHGDVDAGAEEARGHARGAEVEQGVRAVDLVGDHRACEHDGLAGYTKAEETRGFGHAVGAVRNDDPAFGRTDAGGEYELAVLVGHVQAVNQMHYLELHRGDDARFFYDLRKVCILKGQLAFELVVMLVKSSAGNNYPQSVVVHGKYCASGRGRKSRKRNRRSP